MKPGQESQTAVLVCMARAMAHGASAVAKYADPTAFALLPENARARVERFRSGTPKGFGERIGKVVLDRRARMMVARTVEIDEAVRGRVSPQLVVLGAGLDGRAWRMPELRDATVFEVDHPDSQRAKRARVATLNQTAREVRFVLRRLGEPLRSAFTGDGMRALLGRYAFEVVRDEALPGIAAQLSGDLGVSTRALKHMRIATADRRSPAGGL